MIKRLILACLLIPQIAFATGRPVDADYVQSTDHSKVWTPPLATDTLVGRASSDTLTNKAINGSNNTITNVSLTSGVTGTLPVSSGGTGQTSFTDGQLLIGNTSTGFLSKATLTAGTNISITNGNGSISIASSGSAPAWSYVSQSSTLNPAAAGSYYLLSGASFTITLPTAVGIAGQGFIFKHNGTNFSQVYTFNTTSSQTIDTIASGAYALYTNGETLQLISDGANWQIAYHKTQTPIVDAGVSTPTSTSGAVFTISSSSVTAGAVYSNNSQLFYVTLTVAPSTTLTCSGTGAASASGTLTKVSGTGPSTITFSAVVATGTPTKGSATIISDHNWWHREAQYFYWCMDLAISSAGTATAGVGDYLWWPLGSYNANLLIDTTAVTINGGAAWLTSKPTQITGYVGNGWETAATNSPSGAVGVMVYDSTKLRMAQIDMSSNFSSGNAGGIGSGHINFAQASEISVCSKLPILGWEP